MKLTAIIEREGTGYVALCPELEIASQGDDVPGARDNLREAVELFLECASPQEIQQRVSPQNQSATVPVVRNRTIRI